MSEVVENSQITSNESTFVEQQNNSNERAIETQENGLPSQNDSTSTTRETTFLNDSTTENGKVTSQESFNMNQTDPAIDNEVEQGEKYDGLDISQRLEIAKQQLGETAVIGEIVKSYAPLIVSLNEAIRRIYNSYEYAQFNKQISNALLDRIDCIGSPIKALKRRKDKIEENFLNQDYYNSLMKLLAIVKKAQHFITDISYLWSLRKFPNTNAIKERFERIAKEFDRVISEMPLEVSLDNELQKRKDEKAIEHDIAILDRFLEKIGPPVTIVPSKIQVSPLFEEIILIKSYVNENNGNEIRTKQVPPAELVNNANPGINTQRGNVRKRYWLKEKVPVACKRFDTPQTQKFQDQLIVMNKLSNCPYLLKFHGLSALEWEPLESTIMVFEWVGRDNLKTMYEKFSISWSTKLDLAIGICRGLLFLHGSDILHYDLRCENIFVTENLEPKIANFRLCRPLHDEKNYVRHDDPAEHWASPEHLKNDLRLSYYTAKSDIFSFGMLLWELFFDRIPYRGWDAKMISNHVQEGKRENIDFGPNPTRIQLDFSKIIRAAWQDDAALRPGLYKIFLQLDELHNECPQGENEKIQPRKFDDEDIVIPVFSNQEEQENINNNGYQSKINDNDLSKVPIVKPLLRFAEGLTTYEKDYEKAWEFFNLHASIGNSQAKYWIAHYLWNGYHVQQNQAEAVKLFKEAADDGVPEAQYYYAKSLIEGDTLKNPDEFIYYLTDAAHNNYIDAFVTLGNVYVKGTYGITLDKEKGLHYLKLAGLREDQGALDLLKELGEELFPS
ncbi:kinase-like domain-containing protein [Glomus cerebriforme]|uniref:Kinase-like domain-containing protein n=1 Tax=Glomus cerebriforme TaxID=658196 RepID=A0A397T355_9GLOM|nr:kinase-like domain-containing protein [Glomus cerebriforme]